MNDKGTSLAFSIIIFLLILPYSHADADVFYSDYEKVKNTQLFELYIGGVGNGFAYANANLTNQGQIPLYCEPPKLALQSANYVDILDREIQVRVKNGAIKPEWPVEMILLYGLIRTFPCK